ncbi:hypothetical protein COCNU_16G000850 [Cocos nucifera]|uniref:DUF4220 domain-containing protein n=1 Tax=Cocos nucifera TaxID=13894 RepID=A0A8K0IXQ8_COCNU|nr:hypothetical protein COCNU_16G000850 [Cocos nucifera]
MVSLPQSVRRVWEAWNTRGVILFSLSLQTFLILCAPLRKGTAQKLIILLIWSAYLLADWAASFCIGLIANNQGDSPDPNSTPDNIDLLVFWSPFLLLHLGGPDAITAFALEDNELWLRHLITFIFQAVATGYTFAQTLPGNKLWVPTLLMFLAGVIKYLERTRALYLASLDRFRDTLLKEPDPGPDYAKLMEEYASKREANLPTMLIMVPQAMPTGVLMSDEPIEKEKLSDLQVVQTAYHYFGIFKGLIVDLIFSFYERVDSQSFLASVSAEDALRVLEVELNFFYEVLFTKAVVVHSKVGYCLRFISFSSVVAAFAIFHFRAQKRGSFVKFDLGVTYTLLFGAIALDMIAFAKVIFSDWTAAHIKLPDNDSKSGWTSLKASIFSSFLVLKRSKWHRCETEPFVKHTVPSTPILFRRWSGFVSGHNLIRYCLRGYPKRIHKIKHRWHLVIDRVIRYLDPVIKAVNHDLGINRIPQFLGIGKMIRYARIFMEKGIDFVGLKEFVDEIMYVSEEPLTKELWEFIFGELKKKCNFADDQNAVKRICSARGDWVLQHSDSSSHQTKLMPYVTDVAYDESLLLWHIATELCYNSEEPNRDNYTHREFSKVLSDYMLYLLIMQPTMMSAVAGIAKIRFQDTRADAERFFRRNDLGPNDEKTACKKILDVRNFVKPGEMKGDKSKSVLFDASMLAKELQNLENRWEIMSKVWVELLSYAAIHCRGNTHAQQVSKGGEFVSFIWLLMVHFGISEQFQIYEQEAKAGYT